MPERASEPAFAEPPDALGELGPHWDRVDRLLERGSTAGVLAHRLGAIAAVRLAARGLPVPAPLHAEERLAAIQMLSVSPLLQVVRANCDGPLVLMKGAEIAVRYPQAARTFADVDLLVPDASTVHRQLKAAGFVEYEDFGARHHLCPLRWPMLPVFVEVHSSPNWPKQLPSPSAAEVIAEAVPSALGIDGILAPEPARHALLVAAHSWAHEPLRRLRDLLDVAVVLADVERNEVERIARSWQVGHLWRTTARVADALFAGGPAPLALRLWARHLAAVRERNVLENHLQRWLSGYWALPPRAAAAGGLAALWADLGPAPEERWRTKLVRTGKAVRNARMPLSSHDLLLGEEATRGRGTKSRDDVDG